MAEHKPKRDIVDRLLDLDEVATRSICADDGGCFRCEAADEIRFLREEVERLKRNPAEHQGYILLMRDTDGLR
jgi:hypothetical protein